MEPVAVPQILNYTGDCETADTTQRVKERDKEAEGDRDGNRERV